MTARTTGTTGTVPTNGSREITGMARGLSPAQRNRRDKMLRAAVELASAGGYDAVGMREVAERAEVALGTLYRHFPSKDHLLLGVMADALERLHSRMRKTRPQGDTVAERVTEVLRRSTRSMLRTPALSGAILRAWVLNTDHHDPNSERIAVATRETIWWAMDVGGEPTDADLQIMKIVNRVWFGELVFWVNGRETEQELFDTIEVAVARLYPD